MSKTNTKATINANIKQNGVQAITGQILNSVLNQMVDDYGTQGDLTELVNQVRKIGVNVNYRDAIRQTFPSFNVLSMRTSIVNVLETDGTLLACILPSTMTNSGWLYEYEEGWRLCKVQGFTLTNTSTWEDLLDWMDLEGNSTKIAGETALNELRTAVATQAEKLTELAFNPLYLLGVAAMKQSVVAGQHLALPIDLFGGRRYRFEVTLDNPVAYAFYIAIKDSSGTNLISRQIAAGSTSIAFDLNVTDAKLGSSIDLYCSQGVGLSLRVSANIGQSLSDIKAWLLSESYTASNIARDADGIVTSLTATYPDGETGSITITRDSEGLATKLTASYKGAAYILDISRDADGNVTSTNFE